MAGTVHGFLDQFLFLSEFGNSDNIFQIRKQKIGFCFLSASCFQGKIIE